MKRNLIFLIAGALILSLFVFAAVFPQALTPYSTKDMFEAWLPLGSEGHALGTNALGYDIYTELVYGAGETLLTGLAGSVLSLFIGTLIGVLAAGRGVLGSFFNGLINIFVLLPRLICLIVLSGFLGGSGFAIILLIALFTWAPTARTVKAQVLHIQTSGFIESCEILGYSRWHTVLYHVIPNLYDVLLSRFLLGVNSCIMMESTLSFLGLGDLYNPTWGTMMNFAYKRGALLRGAYNYLLAPGICIMLISLSFYLISLYFEGKNDTVTE